MKVSGVRHVSIVLVTFATVVRFVVVVAVGVVSVVAASVVVGVCLVFTILNFNEKKNIFNE